MCGNEPTLQFPEAHSQMGRELLHHHPERHGQDDDRRVERRYPQAIGARGGDAVTEYRYNERALYIVGVLGMLAGIVVGVAL